MTNLGITGHKICEVLDKNTIRKGGLVNVTMPTLSVDMSNEHEGLRVEFGGYPSLVFYNKAREKQDTRNKRNKKIRENNKTLKKYSSRLSGNEFPEVPNLLGLNGVARKINKS